LVLLTSTANAAVIQVGDLNIISGERERVAPPPTRPTGALGTAGLKSNFLAIKIYPAANK
jgi:hypothetical protein